jgi:diguanylate cyclase (GGDEF)-like protein/PAS domain S-box-containing protein
MVAISRSSGERDPLGDEYEAARLRALYAYELLDTPRESQFDRITAIGSRHFGAPCALALVDAHRLWIKSTAGLELAELERDLAPCRFTIDGTEVLVIPDTLEDERTCDSRFARDLGIRFYAGAPLINPDGFALGTLVVLDTKPRAFTSEDVAALSAFASIALDEIELRRRRRSESAETRQLRLLLSQSPLAIFTTDTLGNVLSWNPGAAAMFGYTADEVIGGLVPVFRPVDRQAGERVLSRVLTGETVSGWRVAARHRSRRLVEDVSERVRRERRDAHRSRALEVVASGGSREDALRAIVNVVESSFPGSLAVIAQIVGDEARFLAASPRIDAMYRSGVDRIPLGDRVSPCSRAIETRTTTVFHDVDRDPSLTGLEGALTATPPATVWSSPIAQRDGAIVGALVVNFSRHVDPLPGDLRLLADAAHLSAIVIERYADSERLVHLALYDELTGLPNRVYFEQRVRQLLASARRSGDVFAIGMVDLDRFKAVNDTYGHRVGDDVLEQTAALLAKALRPGDLLARRGGDEFLLLLPNISDERAALAVGERLCASLRPDGLFGDIDVTLRVSVGLTLVPRPGSHADPRDVDTIVDRALNEADVAMYEAKQAGDRAIILPR